MTMWALGAGKYGARAEQLRQEVEARIVVVITIGGSQGDAFDVASVNPSELLRLPTVLRTVAAGIEADLRSGRSDGYKGPGGQPKTGYS